MVIRLPTDGNFVTLGCFFIAVELNCDGMLSGLPNGLTGIGNTFRWGVRQGEYFSWVCCGRNLSNCMNIMQIQSILTISVRNACAELASL